MIIGSSIAGLSAANRSAESNKSILCIDKKEAIGSRIHCAEGVGSYLLSRLPFKLPKKIFLKKIKGISFWAGETNILREGDFWEGYNIDRKNLEIWLAKSIKKKGVEIRLNSSIIDLVAHKNFNVATIKSGGEIKKIKCNFLIAADGASSPTEKLLGLNDPDAVYGFVKSFEFKNIKLGEPNFEHIFYGPFSPGGYGYIFPKSKSRANVGVGTTNPSSDLNRLFSSFCKLKNVKTNLHGKKIVEEKSGIAIINKKITYEHKTVLFAGDSACVNLKPFVEGIIPSIISGNLAGGAVLKFQPGAYKKKLVSMFKTDFVNSKNFFNHFKRLELEDGKKKYLLMAGLASNAFSFHQIPTLLKLSENELIKRVHQSRK